ncbi:MAG: tetratricopeptide repeat protein [Spirochaetia bacterium]|nr:tetratricopeptide repeat protein [Spirochaetia bacterium]
MKKYLILLIPVFLLAASSSKYDKFYSYIKNNQYDDAKRLLDNWGNSKENDPQYYICAFNYYIIKSSTEVSSIEMEAPANGRSLELSDPINHEIKGYIVFKNAFNPDVVKKGINIIKEGIQRFPDHYEMRFGLLWIYQELFQFDSYITEFEDAFRFLKQQHLEKFYWNDNVLISNPSDFLIERVQQNLNYFMKTKEFYENPVFLNQYVDLMIKYYPDHKYGYSNKGVLFYIKKDYQNALKYYLTAYNLDKSDLLVITNIGFTYKMLNDIPNAKEYFTKVLNIGTDKYFTGIASKQLKLLK